MGDGKAPVDRPPDPERQAEGQAAQAGGWSRRANWTDDCGHEVKASLDNHLSALAALPVAEITTAIAAKPIRKVEDSAPDMAMKVRQRLRAIMDYAAEHGLIPLNPIPAPRRGKRSAERTHLAAITDHQGVGAILRAADVADVSRGVRRAHLPTVFTAQRIGEIVGARWDEFDLQAGTWAIPRARMKRKDAQRGPHIVPLPPHLVALLREWRRADGDAAIHTSPAPHGAGAITREAVEKFYRRTLELTGKHSPHSWRSVFSTWARDAGRDADVIEAQLDHTIGTKRAAAYDRAKWLEIRREPSGRDVFGDWMKSLNDRRAVAAILLRIGRIQRGLFRDCKSVGDAVQELRIDIGQGHRAYFGGVGDRLIILPCGGDKRGQRDDIEKAKQYWANYAQRTGPQ